MIALIFNSLSHIAGATSTPPCIGRKGLLCTNDENWCTNLNIRNANDCSYFQSLFHYGRSCHFSSPAHLPPLYWKERSMYKRNINSYTHFQFPPSVGGAREIDIVLNKFNYINLRSMTTDT